MQAHEVSIFRVMEALGVYDGGEETTRQMLCPVHSDSRPSARVYAEENRVHCFTCGRGWEPLALVMAVQKVDAAQAENWILDTFGLRTSASFQARLRASLAPPSVKPAALVEYTEQQLRQSRARLTREQFTKLAVAIDMVGLQFRDRVIDVAQFEASLKRIMQRMQSVRR